MTHVEVAARGFCPQCGAELPLGRSGSTVTCAFCNLTSSYTTIVQPLASSGSDTLDALAIVPAYAGRTALIAGWSATTLKATGAATSWAVSIPRTRLPIVTSFERLYVATEAGEIVAVDAATGHLAFVATLPGPLSLVDGAPCIADVSGPAVGNARVLVHTRGQLVALDRMSGAIVDRWPAESPRCWVTAPGYLLVGPAAPREAWLIDPTRPTRASPVARLQIADGAAIDGVIASGHAFLSSSTGDHVAVQLASGELAWRESAPWNAKTGAKAAFARDLFVGHGTTLTALSAGTQVTTPAAIDDVRMIAGTVVVSAGSQLLAYQRTLARAWNLELREFDQVRISDNGRMLVAALLRADQLWVRGLLPTNGKARWNVLVPGTSGLLRHTVIGDLVMIETEHEQYVLRADTGQLVRSAKR